MAVARRYVSAVGLDHFAFQFVQNEVLFTGLLKSSSFLVGSYGSLGEGAVRPGLGRLLRSRMLIGAVLTTAVVLVVGAVVDISTRTKGSSELVQTQLYDIRM
jgi:hypothetical protein